MQDKSNLINFHLDCKDEYHKTLQHFNILFYGYGCKISLLKKLFPLTRIINCIHTPTDAVLQEIQDVFIEQLKTNKLQRGFDFFENLEKYLEKRNKTLKIILINFDFNLHALKNKKRIKIIATYERLLNTEMYINEYNFIFRDLTTFETYKLEIKGYNIQKTNKIEQVTNIVNSVSKKTRKVFLLILETYMNQNFVSFVDLMKKVGKKFLYTKISDLNQHLVEFYDHNIIKRKEESGFTFEITTKEKIAILEKLNKID